MSLTDEPVVVVVQRAKFVSTFADYDLFRPDGTPLGSVVEEQTLGGMFARKLSNLRFVIADTGGATVATIEKPPAFGRSSFDLYDAAGAQLGSIEQQNLMFDPQFSITTPTGQLQLTSAAVMAWDWQLTDTTGHSVGRITREFAGLADLLTTAEHFVVQISEALSGSDRLAALAACVCLDVVRDNKRRR